MVAVSGLVIRDGQMLEGEDGGGVWNDWMTDPYA
jgi:hypothetical protein